MNGFNHWVQREAVRKYVHDLTNTIYTLVWRTRVCLYKLVHICKEITEAWGNDGWEWCGADRQQGAGTVKWMIDELTSGLVLKVGYLGNCIDYRYVVLLYVGPTHMFPGICQDALTGQQRQMLSRQSVVKKNGLSRVSCKLWQPWSYC